MVGVFKKRFKKVLKSQQVADESVVVRKIQPMKAGNRLEEKTESTIRIASYGPMQGKSLYQMRRDEVLPKSLEETDWKQIVQTASCSEMDRVSRADRPGRSCHDAIRKAELFMRRYDLGYVVDMDLSACFDTLNHDFLMRQLQKKIADGSMLKLIELFLKSGVMVGNELKEVTEGSPQGGVISPLLANIYLDYFDQWSRERGYRIVRYADDTLIFSRSHKAAVRRLKAATAVLEGEMGLRVNEQKTQVTSLGKGVEYLGVVIRTTYTTIQHKKVKQFKEKVKRLTNRSGGKPLWRVIAELNPLLRGFAHYFRIANGKGRFREFMTWIRRRLRAIQLRLWKKPRRLHRRLRQLGYSGVFLYIKMQSWASARSPLASMAMPNGWLYEQGLYNMELVFSVHR